MSVFNIYTVALTSFQRPDTRLSFKVASYLLSYLEKYKRYRLLYRAPSKCPVTPWGNATLLLNKTVGAPEGFRPSKGIIEERLMLFLMSPVSLETFRN